MCSPFDPTCVAQTIAATAFEGIANTAGRAAAEFLARALTFWVATPSVNPDSAVVRELQNATMPIVAVMLLGSMLWQSIRMVISRKKDPLINIASGLLRYAVVSSVGLALLAGGLQAGDALAASLIDQGVADYAERMQGLFVVGTSMNPFVLLLLSVLALLLGGVQWVVMTFRHAGLLVLAAMFLIAASGSMNDATKPWLGKVAAWSGALVAYKPAAALIYRIGFSLMGTGQDLETVMTGVAVLFLAVVALPVLLKFFSWSTVAVSGGAGIGGVLAAGALGAVSLAGAVGRSPGEQSAQTREQSGPGSSAAGVQASATGASSTEAGSWAAPGTAATGAGATGGAGAGAAGGGAGAAAGGAGAAAGGAGAAAGAAGPAAAAAAQAALGAQRATQAAAGQMASPPDDGPAAPGGGADGAART